MRVSLVLLLAGCGVESDLSGPQPELSSVTPDRVCNAMPIDITLTLTGANLLPVVLDGLTSSPMVAMPLASLDDGDIFAMTVTSATGDTATATLHMDTGLILGGYDVIVGSPGGASRSTLPHAFTVDAARTGGCP